MHTLLLSNEATERQGCQSTITLLYYIRNGFEYVLSGMQRSGKGFKRKKMRGDYPSTVLFNCLAPFSLLSILVESLQKIDLRFKTWEGKIVWKIPSDSVFVLLYLPVISADFCG